MRNLHRFLFFVFVFFLILSALLLGGFFSEKQFTLESPRGLSILQFSIVSGFITLCIYVARRVLKEKIDMKEKRKDKLIQNIGQS